MKQYIKELKDKIREISRLWIEETIEVSKKSREEIRDFIFDEYWKQFEDGIIDSVRNGLYD